MTGVQTCALPIWKRYEQKQCATIGLVERRGQDEVCLCIIQVVLNYGWGAHGWAFIEKPFVPVKLLEMINVVLRTPDKPLGSRQYNTRNPGEE